MGPTSRTKVDQNKGGRIGQACLHCQEKKIRCDGKRPGCTSCCMRELNCSYLEVQKRRGPGRSKLHTQRLEERLKSMELILQSSLSIPPENGTESIAEQNSLGSGSHATRETPNGDFDRDSNPLLVVEIVSDNEKAPHNANSVSPKVATSQPNSSSVETSDMTLETQALRTKRQFSDLLSFLLKNSPTERFHDTVSRVKLSPSSLLESSIESIYNELPFIHIPTFSKRLKPPHGAEKGDDPIWWGCFNAVMATSIQHRTVNVSFANVSVIAWKEFKSSYSVFPEVMLLGNNIAAVQTILAMAIFMSASADTRLTALLVSVAIRMAYSLGLHRRGSATELEPLAAEMSMRVFWTAYILDADISFNFGLPTSQSYEDVDVGLPNEHSSDGSGVVQSTKDFKAVNIFRLRAELSTIQHLIRRRLYTRKAFKHTDKKLLDIVQELDHKLEEWRSRVPASVRPAYDSQTMCTSEMIVVLLHFAYYNCISMVHWAIRRHSLWLSAKALRSKVPTFAISYVQIVASDAKYREAARAILQLIEKMPSEFVELWRSLCYPVSATLTLLSNILENPSSQEANSDHELLHSFIVFLESMVNDGCDLRNALKGFAEAGRIASCAISNGQPPSRSQTFLPSEATLGIAKILGSATHPMHITKRLMGNFTDSDCESGRKLAMILGIDWKENTPYGPFVPSCLMPQTYTFGVEPSNSA